MDELSAERADEIDEELLARVKPELQPGERLLWAARARALSPLGDRLPGITGCLWAAGFFFVCVLLLFLGDSPRFRQADGVLSVTGLLSGVIGVFVVIGTLSNVLEKGTARQQLKGRVYALTDRRAMIWCPVPKSAAVKVYTFQRGSIKAEEVLRVEYPDGSGDVNFHHKHQFDAPDGFAGISDVRQMEELVRRVLIESGREGA